MKLKKINGSSAIGVGIIFAAFYFVLSVVKLGFYLFIPGALENITSRVVLQSLIAVPLGVGIAGALFTSIVIFAYNKVAQKHPISWELAK